MHLITDIFGTSYTNAAAASLAHGYGYSNGTGVLAFVSHSRPQMPRFTN